MKQVLKVETIYKKFTLGYKNLIAYGLIDAVKQFFNLNTDMLTLRTGEFYSLQNINFAIDKGDVLGIIGRNGSGKSTLLKLINGIYWPDQGTISVNGKIGALIGAGAAFQPLLTGRENIYLSGAIYGMTKAEIETKFDSIVDFAGISDFLDAPVKNYSAGMHARLGFSINMFMDLDILIIDEVIAVGDIEFRQKCFNKLRQIVEQGKTIIFVSHRMEEVKRICNKSLWLNQGQQMSFGETRDVIKDYLDFIKHEATS